VLRTPYKIDDYQDTYFVIDSFAQLFDATAPDFTPIYERVSMAPPLPLNGRLPGERLYPPNAPTLPTLA
jgi:phenylalanine-4-hydroxylase